MKYARNIIRKKTAEYRSTEEVRKLQQALHMIKSKSKSNQYKSPRFTDNNIVICTKGDSYMKATGIVRRIDDCGIITQRGLCRINTGVLLILSKN